MKKFKLFLILSMIFLLFVTGYSQMRGRGKMNSRKTEKTKTVFNVDDKVFIIGKIDSILNIDTVSREGDEVIIVVNNSKELFDIKLSPKSYLVNSGIKLERESIVRITAFKGELSGKIIYYAATISVSGKNLVLRDSLGNPKWQKKREKSKRGIGNGKRKGMGRGRKQV